MLSFHKYSKSFQSSCRNGAAVLSMTFESTFLNTHILGQVFLSPPKGKCFRCAEQNGLHHFLIEGGMGIMKLKNSLFKKLSLIFPCNYLQYLNAWFGNEEQSLWSTATRKRSEKWQKMLKPLWMEVVLWFEHLHVCRDAQHITAAFSDAEIHRDMHLQACTCVLHP